MKIDAKDVDAQIEGAGLKNRGAAKQNMRRPLKSADRTAYLLAEARRADDVKAQHGPVRQIMKDGKPCL